MLCPKCHSGVCRRSRRRGIADQVLGLVGLRPWRCKTCEARFHAWQVARAHVFYAHCSRCGNFQLRQISRDHVDSGWFVGLRRALHIPAYRCEPCRRRFFSLRAYHPIAPTRTEAPSGEVLAP